MPAKKPAAPGTLAFLAESGQAVYIVCGDCGRFAHANLYEIARVAGWRARIEDVTRRLRCNGCWQRRARFSFDRPDRRPSLCPRCGQPFPKSKST